MLAAAQSQPPSPVASAAAAVDMPPVAPVVGSVVAAVVAAVDMPPGASVAAVVDTQPASSSVASVRTLFAHKRCAQAWGASSDPVFEDIQAL
mmetsp:Transcript_83893/g.166514  ORF Transcript_83893/g.166514 Transcript_83893/m.166514 type:complete len:92 (-) Transcript_83893:1347-1622(-)